MSRFHAPLMLAFAGTLFAAASSAQAQRIRVVGSVTVQTAPPAPQVETPGNPPQPGAVWVSGYWNWNGSQYVWVAGQWQRPQPNQSWDPPRWEQRKGGWKMTPGRWVRGRRVGGGPGMTPMPPPVVVAPPVMPPPPVMAPPPVVVAPGRGRWEEYPEGNGKFANVEMRAVMGQPRGFQRGRSAGYWIWVDDAGWHLRTTTAGADRRFQGRIGDAQLTGTTRIEMNDRIVQKKNSILFDFQTKGGIDGLDFKAGDGAAGCIRFNLRLDGTSVQSVFLGARQQLAPGSSFTVCPDRRDDRRDRRDDRRDRRDDKRDDKRDDTPRPPG